ncbi:hypothetical protein AB0E85_26960 [Streptomyces sp. NPDC029044]|uniref:hypothetical protein n=1 Tax=Streptomyces sp. NPDC029044 TaxID=3157198 RepID=UPI00340C994D
MRAVLGRRPAGGGRTAHPAGRVPAEKDGGAGNAGGGVDEQELADGAVSVHEARAVPAGFWVSVCSLLAERDVSGAVDQEPAGGRGRRR